MGARAGVPAFALALMFALACPSPALAQSAHGPSFQLEAASDERRRGISWSGGDPVLRASASLPLTPTLTLDAAATSLWGSDRHSGADAVIDLGATFSRQAGGWTLDAIGRYHLFPGASGDQGYGEIGANAAFLIGPASMSLFAYYAPDQSAIGGDNLYAGTAAAIGIPATPFTLSAHIGRSSGSRDDPARSRRLRPEGSYWDHGVALDYYRGRWSAGLRYAGSSIEGDTAAARHSGASLIARLGLSL